MQNTFDQVCDRTHHLCGRTDGHPRSPDQIRRDNLVGSKRSLNLRLVTQGLPRQQPAMEELLLCRTGGRLDSALSPEEERRWAGAAGSKTRERGSCGGSAADCVFSNFSIVLSEESIEETEIINMGVIYGQKQEEDDIASVDLDDWLYFPPEEKVIDISKHVRDRVHLEIKITAICDPLCKESPVHHNIFFNRNLHIPKTSILKHMNKTLAKHPPFHENSTAKTAGANQSKKRSIHKTLAMHSPNQEKTPPRHQGQICPKNAASTKL
ncbi:hypothetical protein LXL04_034699 [Taraxacum kok-saghyz]